MVTNTCREGRKLHEKDIFQRFHGGNDFPLSTSVFYSSLCCLGGCDSASKNRHQSVGTFEDSSFGVGATGNVKSWMKNWRKLWDVCCVDSSRPEFSEIFVRQKFRATAEEWRRGLIDFPEWWQQFPPICIIEKWNGNFSRAFIPFPFAMLLHQASRREEAFILMMLGGFRQFFSLLSPRLRFSFCDVFDNTEKAKSFSTFFLSSVDKGVRLGSCCDCRWANFWWAAGWAMIDARGVVTSICNRGLEGRHKSIGAARDRKIRFIEFWWLAQYNALLSGNFSWKLLVTSPLDSSRITPNFLEI